MSLRLHLASRSEELLAALRPALARARAAALGDPTGIPRPVPVLVPSAQLGDWLRARLARELGISMGFDFVAPGDYFARAFSDDTEAREFSAASAWWSPDRVRWRILPLVDEFSRHLGHAEARGPLRARDRFAYAELLARQLDRYARHRPDWPARWNAGKTALAVGAVSASAREDEAWQSRLWRALASDPSAPPHPAVLLAEWASRPLQNADAVAAGVPLFVIGADLLDPLLLATLRHLAARGREISLHMLLPSLGYLGDQSRREALRRLAETTPADEAIELGGHPLLGSLGQRAAGDFLLLEALSPDFAEWPDASSLEEPLDEQAPLLARLQADVRAQRSPARRGKLLSADRSVRVHACHSPRRELEVLRDELLRAFDEIPGLKPEEVLVAAIDFDAYASLAPAIFRSAATPLPVRLTAIPAREANPVAAGLVALLRLAAGRHGASELIELLNLAAVRQNLDLATDDAAVAHLAGVIRSSGLTHDIDATLRGDVDATGTWRAAIDRHLAGAWLGDEAEARDAAGQWLHPLSTDLHQQDETRARFLVWLTRLAEQQLLWRADASAAQWAERLALAVKTLLHSEENDDHAAAVLRFLGELSGVAADTPLDVGAILDWLEPRLENATSLRTSLGGEILFGRLDQLHGLPCRVFALLGLQDGAFPRASRRPAWDLLAHSPERWDADSRRQDRQHFLDALLAPRDRFILTAANRSLRTAHDGPLASCVEEVLRAAAATVGSAESGAAVEKAIVTDHRIQPFAREYFCAPPASYDAAAARIARGFEDATAAEPETKAFAAGWPEGLDEEDATRLTLEQLIRFWRDPAAAWLRALNIEVERDEADDTELDDAPISLDGLASFTVNDVALHARLSSDAAADARLAADRALPPGELGRLAWRRHARIVAPLAGAVDPLLKGARVEAFEFSPTPRVTLAGSVRLGVGDWALIYRPAKYEKRPEHQLTVWISVVVAAAALARPIGARVCGLDEEIVRELPAIAPEEARRHLAALIAGWRRGVAAPLPYAPNTSSKMAEALTGDAEEEANALAAGCAAWFSEGGFGAQAGEGLKPAGALAWRDGDPFAESHAAEWIRWARDIAAPLAAWWQEGAKK